MTISEPHSTDDSRSGTVRVTVIIVNYESWADTARLANSLSSEPEFHAGQCELVIVDNDSASPIHPDLETHRSGVRIIRRPNNGGFAVGVNTGWRAANSPWLLLLNPDVEIVPGFLQKVLTELDHYERVPRAAPGIVGFALKNPDGSTQGSVGGFPNLSRTLREQFLPRSRRKYQAGWQIQPGPVDWVTGACMLVNTRMIEQSQGMNEDFFLYYEEVDFSRSAHKLGWSVVYNPNVEVVHRYPLQSRAISPKIRVITRHSKMLYFLEHLPRWQFQVLLSIVSGEAHLHALWAKLRGNEEELRGWRVIAQLARRFRQGKPPRGRDVLTLAESVVNTPVGSAPRGSYSTNPRPILLDRQGRTREHSA